MANPSRTINVGVVKSDENIEYSGKVKIEFINDGFNCKYNLVNILDKKKFFKGEFFSKSLANIVSRLDTDVVNVSNDASSTTLIDANKA